MDEQPPGETTDGDHELLKKLMRSDKENNHFWSDLDNESDRGVALVSGAYFEQALGRCLTVYLTQSKSTSSLLSGALQHFAPRIDACHSLRIIDTPTYERLQIVKRIRNEFAHRLLADFEDDRIKNWVVKLANQPTTYFGENENTVENGHSPRSAFSAAVLILSLDLQGREVDISKYSKGLPSLIPNDVITAARKEYAAVNGVKGGENEYE